MFLNRRTMMKYLGVGMGMVAAAPLLRSAEPAVTGPALGPRRVIFFLQNHGFDPKTAIPEGIKSGESLAGKKLPKPMEPLQPYTERMHIINGLHGKHTRPDHSAYFGALGGYAGGAMLPPSAPTIDYVLSQTLPQTIIPHLSIGMDSLMGMRDRSTLATLSASGAKQPLYMYSNPTFLYQLLYSCIATGDIKTQFDARCSVLDTIHNLASGQGKFLPTDEIARYGQFVDGFQDMSNLQKRLQVVSDHLKKFAPKVDDRYLKPEFETDWHDVLLELGISALKAGVTNTLTIASGRGEVAGSWFGIGVQQQGHGLGHLVQPGSTDVWDKIRQYNARMLVKIMKELESVPEGRGTMMDNTLIVYTSNNAEKQHTKGDNWPMVLLGNFAGRIKTGKFTHVSDHRPINALYATILQAAQGKSVERFNMEKEIADAHDRGIGPLKEVLA